MGASPRPLPPRTGESFESKAATKAAKDPTEATISRCEMAEHFPYSPHFPFMSIVTRCSVASPTCSTQSLLSQLASLRYCRRNLGGRVAGVISTALRPESPLPVARFRRRAPLHVVGLNLARSKRRKTLPALGSRIPIDLLVPFSSRTLPIALGIQPTMSASQQAVDGRVRLTRVRRSTSQSASFIEIVRKSADPGVV
jgi:hypothetical protein